MNTSPSFDAPRTGTFRVAGWEVDPRGLRLRRNGEERRLEQRVMALLVCLAEQSGETVTRDELLERVWWDVVVGDDAVHSAVSKLRRALGGRGGKTVIETVPKVGYRLVAPVRWSPSAPENAGGAPPRPGAPSHSVPGGTGIPAPLRQPSPHPAAPRRAAGLPRLSLVVAAALLGAGALAWTLVRPGDPTAAGGRPDVRPVTSWAGLEVQPALSPGGTGDRLAFAWKGPAQDNWDVWVQVLGAGDPLRVTSHPAVDQSPAWSPDGRHLSFLRHDDGRCAVMQVPALGGPERTLSECNGGEHLTWSPDGTRLLWTERPSAAEPFRIVELALDGLVRREVTHPPPGSLGDLGPAVSPDGETLAFLRSPVLGVEDLYLQPLDPPRRRQPDGTPAGAEPRRLTHDDLKIHGADWMPDGRSLVFSSNRGGLFSLWRVGAGGGEPVWLGASGGDLDAPSVGAAGRRVAFEQWTDDTNVYRLALATGAEPERIAASTRWDWGPHVSPAGDRVVFVSDRSGAAELWSAALDGAEPDRRLTELEGPYLDHPRWSPTGTAVAFDARPGGNADLYLLPGESLRPVRLTRDPAEDVAPSWSRDGRWLYFASNRGGNWQVWRISPGGGEPSQVTRSGGYVAQESPGGRWLYYSRRHEPGIWRRALEDDGPGERVVDDLAPLDRSHWLVTEDALLYVRRPRHDRPVLVRRDLATGRTEELAALGAIPYNSGLALGPEGRSVFFTRADRRESDILVLELGG